MILLVFDEFPADSIAGPDGRIDSTRFPGFAALAGTSTWFPNAHAVSDSTLASVPSILTSTPAASDNSKFKITYRRYRHSLFTLLGSRGYRISATDVDTRICPPRYCSYREPFKIRFPTVRTRVEEFAGFLRSLRRTKRPRFTYLHTLLPHVPWHLSPSGNHRDRRTAATNRAHARRSMGILRPLSHHAERATPPASGGVRGHRHSVADQPAQEAGSVRPLPDRDHGRPRGLLRARGGRPARVTPRRQQRPRDRPRAPFRQTAGAAPRPRQRRVGARHRCGAHDRRCSGLRLPWRPAGASALFTLGAGAPGPGHLQSARRGHGAAAWLGDRAPAPGEPGSQAAAFRHGRVGLGISHRAQSPSPGHAPGRAAQRSGDGPSGGIRPAHGPEERGPERAIPSDLGGRGIYAEATLDPWPGETSLWR